MFFYDARNGADLSDDFHTWEVEWTADHLTYRMDGSELGSVWPPGGGFWELGGFGGNNIWGNGGRMAPFDQPVSLLILYFSAFYSNLTN